MKTTNKPIRIEVKQGIEERRGKHLVYVPHLDGEIAFSIPIVAYGTNVAHFNYFPRGDYFECRKQIGYEGLNTPTFSHNISLVNAAWQNPEERLSHQILSSIENSGSLWGFTGILYVPDEGAYIQDNPKVRVESNLDILVMRRSNLINKLEANDPSVRFVPFGYKINKVSRRGLAKNKFLQALLGEEGAEKFVEVSNKYKDAPTLDSFKNVKHQSIYVPALRSFTGYDSYLAVECFDSKWYGHAFGLARTRKSKIKNVSK